MCVILSAKREESWEILRVILSAKREESWEILHVILSVKREESWPKRSFASRCRLVDTRRTSMRATGTRAPAQDDRRR